MPPPASSAPPAPPEARARLLACALQLFSEQGYARTSTRALAEAAGVNLASIRYYFGDKAGLYRAVFEESCGACGSTVDFTRDRPLPELLRDYFASFVDPLMQGEAVQQRLRLYVREMLEPTAQWQAAREQDAAVHASLVEALRRALDLPAADADLHRLAMAFDGMGMQLIVSRELLQHAPPGVSDSPAALDAWTERLLAFALALVETERQRRTAAARSLP